jgi:hypothetical protein
MFGCACVYFLARFQDEDAEWDSWEKTCMRFAMIAILIGVFSEDFHFAIKTCALAYVLGIFPTIRHAYKKPSTESLFVWSTWLLGSVPYLYLAWGDWTFSSIGTPIVNFALELVMVLILARAFFREARKVVRSGGPLFLLWSTAAFNIAFTRDLYSCLQVGAIDRNKGNY